MTGKPAVDDYDIQYRLAGATDWTEWNSSNTSTTTSVTLTGLTKGKTYEVQVRAGNHEGDGAWSDTVHCHHGRRRGDALHQRELGGQL